MADVTLPKPVGVRIPVGQEKAREQTVAASNGAPRTIVSVSPLQTYLIQFYDGKGEPRSVLLHRAGDQFLVHRSDEAWVKDLREASDWVKKKVKEFDPETFKSSVQISTDVDVLGVDDGDI